ncbi:MAG TPA: hypothetical protein VFB21_09370 [Chthonomonadaceae bacterium]|nr:hypothetical protein [Chthonomonadaceae bacterium]
MEPTESDARIEGPLAVALKSEPETWSPDCLLPERILALAEHSLPEAEATALLAHVALCARCRREYAETVELMQLAEEVSALQAQAAPPPVPDVPPAPLVRREEEAPAVSLRKESPLAFWKRWFSPGLGFALGAAAAGIVLFFAWTAPARVQRDRLASALVERAAQIAQAEQENKALGEELAALQQKQGDAARLTEKLKRLNVQVKDQSLQIARLSESEAVLQQMPLPTPDWMQARESGIVRGGGGPETSAPQIVLLRPVHTALLDTTPTLECRPVSGATGYQISLEREGSNEEVPAPKPLAATRWQVETPLQPGAVYKWAVTAQRGNELLRSPVATFYILSVAEQREIATARQKYAQSPLTLGAVYARLGMLDEAEQQFRLAAHSASHPAVAKRWLQEIEARRSRP